MAGPGAEARSPAPSAQTLIPKKGARSSWVPQSGHEDPQTGQGMALEMKDPGVGTSRNALSLGGSEARPRCPRPLTTAVQCRN